MTSHMSLRQRHVTPHTMLEKVPAIAVYIYFAHGHIKVPDMDPLKSSERSDHHTPPEPMIAEV